MSQNVTYVRIEFPELPLKTDLKIVELTGQEGITQLFCFELDVVSTRPEQLNTESLTGAKAVLIFEVDQTEVRRLHGLIAEVCDQLDPEAAQRTVQLRFVPRLWRLSLFQSQHTYVDQTVPQIIESKLEQAGLVGSEDDYEFRLIGEYPKRDFIMQYQETDLAFINRLAEHMGICFFFESRADRETIVFSDNRDGPEPLSPNSAVRFRPRGEALEVFELAHTRRVVPERYVVYDYNYRNPNLELEAAQPPFQAGEQRHAGGEIAEYGTNFREKKHGRALVKTRAEQMQVAGQVFAGKSSLVAFTAGAKFTLDDHPHLERMELLLVQVEHRVSQAVTGHELGAVKPYTNTFEAMPAERTYRPARTTPRPHIDGVLTGVIQDPDGGSGPVAKVDEAGRYLVRFHFDRNVGAEGPPSRPIRMAQPHAGENYGMHFPLKPGTEVLVAFVAGDPDRPVIVGALPHATMPSPVTKSNPTSHVIRTASGVIIEMDDHVS